MICYYVLHFVIVIVIHLMVDDDMIGLQTCQTGSLLNGVLLLSSIVKTPKNINIYPKPRKYLEMGWTISIYKL